MARIIQPFSQEPENKKSWKQELDITRHVVIYPRVSTPEQMKNVSAEMQQDKTFATNYGWSDALIVMDTSDLGLSGQLRMEDRPAFVNMLRLIANGDVKTVIVAQVDRLFRDRWGQEYSKFMEICFTYGVKVVTLTHDRKAIDFIYEFSTSWHIDQFRRECEAAWRYIEKQIYRMHAARNELAKTGCWAGGALPIGYIPDKRERIDGKINPNYLKYMCYTPHATKVISLYERFRQLAGNVTVLFNEIGRLTYLFEPFSSDVDPKLVSKLLLRKVLGEDGQLLGYTIGSPRGLCNILSNPVYIGYWLHNNQIVSTNNHEPIIDFDLFIYAFKRLSPTNLDGTPNQDYLERVGRYSKRHHIEKPAYLKDVALCADERLRIYEKGIPSQAEGKEGKVRTLYVFLRHKDYGNRAPQYSIPSEDIDGIFFESLKKRLEETEAFADYLDHEEAELKIQSQLLEDVERDIKAVESLMKKIENQVAIGAITDPDLLKITNDTYAGHKIELKRLQERRHDVMTNTAKAQQRRTYKQLIIGLKGEWADIYPPEKLIPREELPMLVETFVTKVVFEVHSNHFYKASLYWRDPEWGVDALLCFRPTHAAPTWAHEEDELVKRLYQTTSKAELMKLLPTRSYGSIQDRANSLGVYRTQRMYTGDNRERWILHKNFSLEDCQIIEQYNLYIGHIIKLRKATVVKSTHIIHPENLDTCSG